jgi:HK97 family phage major capsid protein
MAVDIEEVKNEIIEGTKAKLVKELDKILEGKFVTPEEFEKTIATLRKANVPAKAEGTNVPFTKWLQEAKTKGLTEGTDSAGGYTVPPEYGNQIWQLNQKFAQIASKAMQMTVNSNEFRGISLVNDVSVSWVDEGASIPETEPSFGQPIVTIKKLAAMVKLSNELIQDTKANLDPLIYALIARAIAKELDNQLINGTGLPFTGVLNETGTVTVTSGAALADVLEYDDIIDMETAISSDYALNPDFVMHRTIWGKLRKLKDSNSRPLDIVDVKTKTLDGYPYVISERAPSDTSASKPILIYGDWQNAIVAHRKNLQLQILREKYSDTDQTALKFTARFGIKIMAPQAFVILNTAAA